MYVANAMVPFLRTCLYFKNESVRPWHGVTIFMGDLDRGQAYGLSKFIYLGFMSVGTYPLG